MGENLWKQRNQQGNNLQNIQTSHTALHKKETRNPNWKGKEVKISLFADDMILYLETLKRLPENCQSSSMILAKSQDTKSIHRN